MINLVLATFATVAAAAPAAPHQTMVQHRGSAYEVTYQPQVRTRAKTVGLSLGTRMSTERCQWTAEIDVERTIRRSQGTDGHRKLLAPTRLLEGSQPGNCAQIRSQIAAERLAEAGSVRKHVERVAAADRPTLLADIDAAHSLAATD